jgi:hypothetical protein
LLSVNYRGAESRFHWEGFHRTHDIQSGIRNHQQIVDFSTTYQMTKQSQVSISLPIVFSARRALYGPVLIPDDTLHHRKRWWQDANGIGDMTIVARRWVLPVDHYRSGNISLGFGTILPTGSWKSSVNSPEGVQTPVDVSIQPGQGGWGMIAEVQAFKQLFKRFTLFGTGVYVAQPRNTNGTFLNSWNRSAATNKASQIAWVKNTGIGRQVTNSVPDSYLGEIGVAMAVPKVRGLFITGSARLEGSTVRDLIGASAGFRRPGFELFAVPGVGYTRGKDTWSFSLPIRSMINIQNNPLTPRTEDATMPNILFLARYNRII